MKKILALILSLIMILSLCGICAYADDTVVIETPDASDTLSADVYVTISDKDGNLVLAGEKINVTDADSDGSLTITDTLYCAHEAFYDGGAAAGYATGATQYGLSLDKLWGSANGGSYGYYVNNASAWSLTDPVKEGDYVAAYVYTDLVGWSDHYSYFDQLFYTTTVEQTLTVTYSEIGYDKDWNPVSLPVEGALLTVDGEATSFVTDENGEANISFSEPGTYRVSAAIEGKTLVKPIGYIEVKPAATLIGDADGSGEVEILDATHIQRYLVALVAEDEIDTANADADRSGDVTILDATAIQRYLAGIVPEL